MKKKPHNQPGPDRQYDEHDRVLAKDMKKPKPIDIKKACAWAYQVCGALFSDVHSIDKDEQQDDDIKVLDILIAIASNTKIPHRKDWK